MKKLVMASVLAGCVFGSVVRPEREAFKVYGVNVPMLSFVAVTAAYAANYGLELEAALCGIFAAVACDAMGKIVYDCCGDDLAGERSYVVQVPHTSWLIVDLRGAEDELVGLIDVLTDRLTLAQKNNAMLDAEAKRLAGRVAALSSLLIQSGSENVQLLDRAQDTLALFEELNVLERVR